MSNRPHRRRRRTPRVSDQVLRTAAQLTSLLRGCTCEPDLHRIDRHGSQAVVGHDDDCPAADTGTAWVLAPRSTR